MVTLLVMANTDPRSAAKEDIAPVISAYNRRAYFADSILNQMYRIFEDDRVKSCGRFAEIVI